MQVGGSTVKVRPRYFSLVVVPPSDVPTFANGSADDINGKWSKKEGLSLLFARGGHFVEQYRTVLGVLCPVPAEQLEEWSAQVAGLFPTAEYKLRTLYRSELRNRVIRSPTVAHNFAPLYLPGDEAAAAGLAGPTLFGVGGQALSKPLPGEGAGHWSPTHRQGVRLMSTPALGNLDDARWLPQKATDDIKKPLIINGLHPGCVERRSGFDGLCNFDGRLSLVRFGGRYLLYARANLKLRGGGRFVQVASTRRAPDGPRGPYGNFSNLRIDGYDENGPGNVYTAAVKRSPFDGDMLLGLFAVNLGNDTAVARFQKQLRRLKKQPDRTAGRRRANLEADMGNTDGRAFVGLALSCDGLHWSRMVEIAPTTGLHGRTFDQPVDGLLPAGGRFSVLIHRDIYDISPAAATRSRLVRRELDAERMRQLAVEVRSNLTGCARVDTESRRESRPPPLLKTLEKPPVPRKLEKPVKKTSSTSTSEWRTRSTSVWGIFMRSNRTTLVPARYRKWAWTKKRDLDKPVMFHRGDGSRVFKRLSGTGIATRWVPTEAQDLYKTGAKGVDYY